MFQSVLVVCGWDNRLVPVAIAAFSSELLGYDISKERGILAGFCDAAVVIRRLACACFIVPESLVVTLIDVLRLYGPRDTETNDLKIR